MPLAAHTVSYAEHVTLALLAAAGVITLGLWIWTRRMRDPVAAMPADLAKTAVRRRALVRGVGSIVWVAVLGVSGPLLRNAIPDHAAVRSGPTDRQVEVDQVVGNHSLVNGTDELRAREPAAIGAGWHVGFYADRAEPRGPVIVLAVSDAAGNPALAAEKSRLTLDQELTSFFDEPYHARITDVDPGPLGGMVRCGIRWAEQAVECRWDDAATSGIVTLLDSEDLDQAALLALRFRSVAEH
ncbi:hypothetical protein [Streptomyces sp. TLI_171]|uniref:hypothetical protein n=1 Tax=Streptomyces sp. TLI_171 TaxID=1938859 RepID=UPI000C19F806|nr:hypothetical protein [Streptomyces sp. TLI_171]RKE16903.1 hypothetical protein BX266_0149 [Streptomyces sp. TLI_171]